MHVRGGKRWVGRTAAKVIPLPGTPGAGCSLRLSAHDMQGDACCFLFPIRCKKSVIIVSITCRREYLYIINLVWIFFMIL